MFIPPCTIRPSTEKTFAAIDPFLFDKQIGWRIRLGECRKHPGNPLLPRNAPWDRDSNDHLFGQVVRDVNTGIYHLWHTAAVLKPDEQGKPVLTRNFTTYAYSRDGERWARPNLGLMEFEGSTDNSIFSESDHVEHHGVAGWFEDPHDPDPARRYKRPYPLQHPPTLTEAPHSPRGLHAATSPDLIHWTDIPRTPIHLRRGIADTFNHGWWDEDLRRYIIITRTHTTIASDQGMRSVGRVESEDFHHWSPIETVFVDTQPGPDVRQYYAMPTWKYAGGYLGLLYIFHSKPIAENDFDTPMDVELAWSRDSIHWQQVCKGQPLIPRGEKGSFDAGRIFALWTPIDLPDALRVYYGGVSLGKEHTYVNWKPTTSGVGLATFRKDGLAALECESNATALATSRLLQFESQHRFMLLNADAAQGRVRVGLLDVLGTPIRGYSVDDCDPLTGDAISHAVTFKGNADLSRLSGRRVRVVIEAERASFYSLRFV